MSPRRLEKSQLPADLEQVRGLPVATWVRESTAGQYDRFGPAAQRELQDRAIERYGLRDTGLVWQSAGSGRTVHLRPEFAAMLEAARAGSFRLLLVGYVSRFTRNLKQTLIAVDDLHAAGVAVLFCDERILSSEATRWDDFVREAAEAESYSRKLGRRIAEGYAVKRRQGEPGGRPPYGFVRAGDPPILIEVPDRIALVRAIYRRAAEGATDRELAFDFDLRKTHVSELLTNPIYRGILRDGGRRVAVIDETISDQVAEMRSRHSHRHRGPVSYRSYLWSGLISCRACGRRLTGHTRRYRHIDACADFRAARPGAADGRGRGESYKAEVYDAIVPRALAHVAINAAFVAQVADAVEEQVAPLSDPFTVARIRRDRAQATRRLETDRDALAWRASWERLDAEEASAKARLTPPVSPHDVAHYLADLPGLYAAAEPTTRHRIVQALFEQVEVLGPNEIWLYPSLEAEALGWAAAMSGEFRMELRKTGRGERVSASLNAAIPSLPNDQSHAVGGPPRRRHEAHGLRRRPLASAMSWPHVSRLADRCRVRPNWWASGRAPRSATSPTCARSRVLSTEQLIYVERAVGWLVVPSLEPS